jgi:CRISPR/Cas system-associated exonuclease Cas4 (RecB family)
MVQVVPKLYIRQRRRSNMTETLDTSQVLPTQIVRPLANGIMPHKSWTMYDSSKVQTFMECPRKYFYRYVLGWDQEQPSIHLIFGEAWHRAMAILLREGYTKDAVEHGYSVFLEYYRESYGPEMDDILHPKSPGGALLGLLQYVKEYTPIDNFEVLHTEIAGSVPISPEDRVSFRIDGLVKQASGITVLEHKTGSRLDNSWKNQWRLSLQVRTYTHVMNCLYPPEEIWGAIVNGTFFYKDRVGFDRQPIRTNQDGMNNWLFTISHWVDRIKEEHEALENCVADEPVLEAFPMNTCNCTKYGPCPNMNMCEGWANPLRRIDAPPMGMVYRWWDPAEEAEKQAREVIHLAAHTEMVDEEETDA